MSTNPTPAPWRGWFRANKGCAWTQISEGASYNEALDRLLDALASRGGGESLVLPRERSPDGPVARMSR